MKKAAQTIYTLAILEKYQQTKKDIATTQMTPKKLVYNNINTMLHETMLLGASRYGINYIF